MLRAQWDAFPDGCWEIAGTGRTTGLRVGGELAQLFTFRDGKVVRVRDFRSHAEALEAIGLSEQDARADA